MTSDTTTDIDTTTDDRQRKIVLVTGASSGIGASTGRRLAAAGHHVVLAARRTNRLAEIVEDLTAQGCSAEALELDVTDHSAFVAAVDAVVAEHGRIDVYVGNAGIMLLSRLDALLVEQWDRMFDVNVRGLYHGVAAVLPHFTRQGGGHVVTMASVGAHEVPPTSAIYSATKHAAWALSEGLRIESPGSIRVTTVCPGVTESELADHITDDHAVEAMRTYRASAIPASAIADAVAYAVDQPVSVDVNEIIVRPSRQR
ncbi:SDR family oxidoreductase [Nocardioides sp. 1609]|uniref:SDR family oxidoreductase n=1 Tax=Nocardioides sp. 1609 TaxID=2508327 RepID=UPI00106F1BD9|nr:SDR family oxidoreductase [Nocardioides sp. 1609]